jgi:hypothetical protein
MSWQITEDRNRFNRAPHFASSLFWVPEKHCRDCDHNENRDQRQSWGKYARVRQQQTFRGRPEEQINEHAAMPPLLFRRP